MKDFDSSKNSSASSIVTIKKEPDISFTESRKEEHDFIQDAAIDEQDVFYGAYGRRRNNYRGNWRPRRPRYRGRSQFFSRGAGNSRKMNPTGPDGNPSKCAICSSVLHWAKSCPHAEPNHDSDYTLHEANIVLETHVEKKNSKTTLLGQTIGAVILDSGCSKTVCGITWLNCFMDTLPEQARDNMKVLKGTNKFKFGNGEELPSIKEVTLPCVIGDVRVDIVADVVKSDIPLLLSKSSMKKAGTRLDFVHKVYMFGRSFDLQCTENGHYFIPITKPFPDVAQVHHILFVNKLDGCNEKEKLKIIEKLHRQFNHPSSGKLCKLVKDAGVKDEDFLKMLEEFPSTCDICLRFKRVIPKPIVGFPLANKFNDTVAMDIKEIRGCKVLHIIDHATRFSVAARLRSKESTEIIEAVFRYWISYFGAPKMFLTDNGREFNNEKFQDMAQNLNILLKTTAAESPWSNGLNERHNGILGEMVEKTLEDVKCSLDIALAWAVSAKNSLHNVHGFSPNQLVFGSNPNLPNIFVNQQPALEGVTTSEMVADNLNAMHKARKAFIESESSEKLQRALRHQVRPSLAESFETGDLVYFKRNSSNRWMGPGSVIGRDNKQILVKHSGSYIRVHQCRLQHCKANTNLLQKDIVEKRTASDVHPAMSESFLENDQVDPLEIDSSSEENLPDVESGETFHRPIPKRGRGRPPKGVSSSSETVKLPRPGDIIDCKLNADDEEEWRKLRVLSKAEKATGRNRHIMNVSYEDEDKEPFWLDFGKAVLEWKQCSLLEDSNLDESNSHGNSQEHVNDESISQGNSQTNNDSSDADVDLLTEESALVTFDSEDISIAKQKELKSWKDNKVYFEVSDRGQERVSTRWVCGKRNNKLKARLVAKGFQDPEAEFIRTDSPTCSKEGLRIALAVMTSNGWKLNSMDIETAFLQGNNFKRNVYLEPPPEANVAKGRIWKLEKCVYGLNDAARSWYLTVKETLLNLGATMSKHDEALFTWHPTNSNTLLHGMILTHVDDFCWAGSKLFETCVIDGIRKSFKVKSEEHVNFRYVGLDIFQRDNGLLLEQENYVQSMSPISFDIKRCNEDKLTKSEITEVRRRIGQLNWMATQTRPDISYDISELSSYLKTGTVESIRQVNKVIKKAKRVKSQLVIPDLGDLHDLKIVAYGDSSFSNLSDGGSQGGYIIFLVGSNKRYFPLSWQSRRIRRLCKSTQAAETLALVDLAESCFYYRKFILDLLEIPDTVINIPITCKTDNNGLYDSIHSSTQILDKRLRLEMSILREMLSKREIHSFEWIPTDKQIADALTKKGVASYKVMGHVANPKLPLT